MKLGVSIIVIISLIFTSVNSAASAICHYSCKSCVGASYNLCLQCLDGTSLTIVEDPSVADFAHLNSNKQSGICIGALPSKVNALGIVLLIFSVAVVLFVRTPSSLFLVSAFQTFGLIGFVQIAWISPIGFLWQALQYFMVFSWWASGFKTQDESMRQRQYYRLDTYMHQSQFLQNFSIIGLINLLTFLIIISLGIWKFYRNQKLKKQKQSFNKLQNHITKIDDIGSDIQQAPTDRSPQPQVQPKLSTCHLILFNLYDASTTLFYFLIQESCLTILVGLRFEDPISSSVKSIGIIYCIMLLVYMIFLFVEKIWYFPNVLVMYINIWRKILLPVMVVVPYQITYLIVVFMLIISILESFFDYKIKSDSFPKNQGVKNFSYLYTLCSRLTLYKILEIIVIILSGCYIITQLSANLMVKTQIIKIFLTIFIIIFMLCSLIEFGFALWDIYTHKNKVNDTEIPQTSIFDRKRQEEISSQPQHQQNIMGGIDSIDIDIYQEMKKKRNVSQKRDKTQLMDLNQTMNQLNQTINDITDQQRQVRSEISQKINLNNKRNESYARVVNPNHKNNKQKIQNLGGSIPEQNNENEQNKRESINKVNSLLKVNNIFQQQINSQSHINQQTNLDNIKMVVNITQNKNKQNEQIQDIEVIDLGGMHKKIHDKEGITLNELKNEENQTKDIQEQNEHKEKQKETDKKQEKQQQGEQKIRKRKKVMDPQLRKRYGL